MHRRCVIEACGLSFEPPNEPLQELLADTTPGSLLEEWQTASPIDAKELAKA
jgi:hypothetical protein